jgi:hypothetical protein
MCGFVAAAAVRGSKRRARGFFVVGFFCGLTTGTILRGRRRGLRVIGAVARRARVRPRRAGILDCERAVKTTWRRVTG